MKKVIIWAHEIDDLYLRKGLIGGLAIQMRYWAETFVSKGWKVYAPSYNKSRCCNGIIFFKYFNLSKIGVFTEFIFTLYYLLTIKPDLILLRGARRQLGSVALFSKMLGIKLVFLGASDAEFRVEEELINDKKSRILYRYGLRKVEYFVLQNKNQRDFLIKNYGNKKYIIIPNIWPVRKKESSLISRNIDFLWVGNFRDLKRPLWFIQLAKDYPQYRFVMVGGSALGSPLYLDCEKEAKKCSNLEFLGRTDFDDVNKLFERTRVYICTSTIEGFPNTFLQSWSNSIPVITTFDPSDVVKINELGVCVCNYVDLRDKAMELLTNTSQYIGFQHSIDKYFVNSHTPDTMYERVLLMIKI